MARSTTWSGCRPPRRPCRCRSMRASPISRTAARSSSASMTAALTPAIRIMDVSRRSAEALGFRERGTARVRVQYLGRAPFNGDDSYERRYLASQGWAQVASNRAAPARPQEPAAVSSIGGTPPAPLAGEHAPPGSIRRPRQSSRRSPRAGRRHDPSRLLQEPRQCRAGAVRARRASPRSRWPP